MSTQTRNLMDEIEDKDASTGSKAVGMEGVGGRHDGSDSAFQGGGYLDECSNSERSIYKKMLSDNRINELKSHGLSGLWIEVAETVGYDQFILIWQILDKKNNTKNFNSSVRLRIPVFSNFLKFQRNKYILHLNQNGKSIEAIKKILKKELCEDLTIRHIKRLLVKSNIK